jgi:hypothetical protein
VARPHLIKVTIGAWFGRWSAEQVVLTGAKKREDIYRAFENIYPVLQTFRKGGEWQLAWCYACIGSCCGMFSTPLHFVNTAHMALLLVVAGMIGAEALPGGQQLEGQQSQPAGLPMVGAPAQQL